MARGINRKSSPLQAARVSQGCQSTKGRIMILFHAVCVAAYAYSIVYCWFKLPVISNKPAANYMGPLKFLTIWGVHFQLLAGILNILVLLKGSKKWISIRDSVHHSLSLPFGLIVFALFWTLFTIDPSTLVPKDRKVFIPAHINHILHTLVGFSPLVNELFNYQVRKKSDVFIFYSVYFAYIVQLLFFGFYLDFWIYPIFDQLGLVGKFVFIAGTMAMGSLVYIVNGKTHSFIWSRKQKIV